MKSVLLGFSGGIDSCTAAEILLGEGYRVVALTIDTIGDEAMLSRAEAKARDIGIEWLRYDACTLFRREIIDYFIAEYHKGRTPAPCTRCNTMIKWHILEAVANEHNIEHIATGHYFNIEMQDGKHYVAKGLDPAKDQSYYLWGLRQETLQRALTPMGNRIKSEVKERFSDKSESMGICFLSGRHYADFLQSEGAAMHDGAILTTDGTVIGYHNGIARYTIGQRRGSGIPEGKRVVDIDAQNNTITIGDNALLFKHRIHIAECNIVDRKELLSATDITIKIRGIGRNPELPVAINPCGEGYTITTRDAMWAPAKGQPLVFYRNNLVLGGGIVVGFD
ncbi:MAG: tRNA-specific 2-thiouridylase [Alistipes sp.]|nr:tRNA-specific 2-thiouridylase [Alistipes sp.]